MSLWQSTLYAESAGICHGVLRTADSENTRRIRFSLMFYTYTRGNEPGLRPGKSHEVSAYSFFLVITPVKIFRIENKTNFKQKQYFINHGKIRQIANAVKRTKQRIRRWLDTS